MVGVFDAPNQELELRFDNIADFGRADASDPHDHVAPRSGAVAPQSHTGFDRLVVGEDYENHNDHILLRALLAPPVFRGKLF
jgi:hypothetical protein